MIATRIHHREGHGVGGAACAEVLRRRLWIIGIGTLLTKIKNTCGVCIKRKAKVVPQQMAPLPACRLDPPFGAFVRTGMDFGGPFLTKQGRGRAKAKRRGVPMEIVSDNGTSFASASDILAKEVRSVKWETITNRTGIDFLGSDGIKWRLNTPCAPWMGGIFETMIKAAKRAFHSVAGDSALDDEQMETFIAVAESMINGGATGALPEVAGENMFQSYRRVQEKSEHWWNRWRKEILPELGATRKWFEARRNISIDDVAVEADIGLIKKEWKLVRVVQVIKSKDGLVRSATVRDGHGKEYERPVNKLCPVEFQ